MDLFSHRIIEKFREKRSKQLAPLARFLLKVHLTANRLTLISLLCGIASAYFLFDNYLLFLIFGLLHLLGDGLDGVVARVQGVSKYGPYLDFWSDRLIAVLYLIKVGLYLQENYVFAALLLMLLTHSISFFTQFRYKSVYSRLVIFIGLALNLPVAAYLASGAISFYSLTLQFKFWLEKRR